MKNMCNRSLFFDPDEGGAGGGGGGDDIQKRIDAAVETATAGLRENRDTILAEKREMATQLKAMQGQLESLGGAEGVKKLTEFQKRLENDEATKLLAEGKHEEWFDQRTAAMRADHENKLTEISSQLEEARANEKAAIDRLNQSMLTMAADTAAAELGVVNSAMADVRLNVLKDFVFDEKSQKHVLKDEHGGVVVGKDGKTPKTIAEYLEDRKKTHAHWYPPSQGANNGGGMGTDGNSPSMSDVGSMSMAQYREHRKSQGMGSGYAGNVRQL